MKNFGIPMLASSGYLAELEHGACTGCGRCVEACPFAALEAAEAGGIPQVSAERCMGCGACLTSCPEQALRLVENPDKGIPLRLRDLKR